MKPHNKDQLTLFHERVPCLRQGKQINLYLPQIQAWCRTRCKPNQAPTIWARQSLSKEQLLLITIRLIRNFIPRAIRDSLDRCISVQIVFIPISTCCCTSWVILIVSFHAAFAVRNLIDLPLIPLSPVHETLLFQFQSVSVYLCVHAYIYYDHLA